MKKMAFFITALLLTFCAAEPSLSLTGNTDSERQVSGRIQNGFRILRIEKTDKKPDLTVYRGDYIRFEFDESWIDPLLSIPGLSIHQKIPGNMDKAPYFKMVQSGTYDFSLGPVNGVILVLDYQQAHYTEVTSEQAISFMKKNNPLVLDVRTPAEFQKGHLKDAILIPVQQFQNQMNKLSGYKDKEILLYCATGNRSTVAAKILIDSGFKHIVNMRYGIADWEKKRYPVHK
ncbi:MAG: rhodanese-like domain-containing protein [Deltaproteobacteria bacterium]|nr:MAG: rhodanese-like domain-containing protein [Deltaproteobacteria bacterium]